MYNTKTFFVIWLNWNLIAIQHATAFAFDIKTLAFKRINKQINKNVFKKLRNVGKGNISPI